MVGYGRYGEVYQVFNKDDKTSYAIKKIKLDALNDKQEKHLRNEIELWAKVSKSKLFVDMKSFWYENVKANFQRHNDLFIENASNSRIRNIKYDPTYTKITGNVLHIQMELCLMTLGEAINKINQELNQSSNESKIRIGSFITTLFLYEIIEAIDYLHSQTPKIIHRDIKPANIFIYHALNGNFIKIGDFGLAVEYGNIDDDDQDKINMKLSQNCGTTNYIAPEVENSTSYDEKCDIYSIGAVGMTICSNWMKAREQYYKSHQERDAFVLWMNLKLNVLSLLHQMKENNPGKRPSARLLMESEWKVELKDIINDPLIYSIMLNKDIDKVKMKPLSHYIIENKLKLKKYKEFDEFKKNRPFNNDYWHGFYWSWMTEFDEIAEIFISENITIDTNLDTKIENECMKMIKHSFAVHTTPELIKDFIVNNISTPNPFGDWKCLIYRDYILEDDLKIINWDNLYYFHAYNSEMNKCDKIFVYYLEVEAFKTKKGSRLFSYPPIPKPRTITIIINLYSEETTSLLLQFVESQEQIILNLKINDHEDSEKVTQTDPNLEILRAILGDSNAFYYLSKETTFLIYHEHFVDEKQLMMDCKCKFAATIGQIHLAVFTYSKSTNDLLQLSFAKNNSDVSQIRIIPRIDYNTYKYSTFI